MSPTSTRVSRPAVVSVLAVAATGAEPGRIERALRGVRVPGLDPLPAGPLAAADGAGTVDGVRRLAERLRLALRETLGGQPCWVGVGGAIGPRRDRSASQREAHDAIALGQLLDGEPRVVVYEEVLLPAALAANPTVRDRLASILDPLAASDEQGASQLLETLDALFAVDLSTAEAARRLKIHRHTIGNRIRQIEEALGRPVRSGRDRLTVELAMIARELQRRRI